MRRIELPERLYRNVEGAAAQFAEPVGRAEQITQLPGRMVEKAGAIEPRDLAVGAGEAEDAVEAADFGADLIYCAAGDNRVLVPERQFRRRSHDFELPFIQFAPWRTR